MYDLFISFKRSDVDYAKKIRNQLLAIDEDLNIFWSECSLEEIGSSDYTKTIENTIPLCRNMLVVGTSLENITSNWVTYEWSLFKHCQLNDTKGVYNNLFLAIDSSVDIHNLPIALQMSECIPIDNYKKIYSYQEKLYLSKAVCFSAIKEFEPKCNWNKCKLIYRSLISDINAKANSISIYFDEGFNTVFVTETAQLSANDSKIFHTFDEMQIKVPLPFEDYDNLIEKYRYGATSFEYVADEFQFSDKGMGLSRWVYPFDEEIYVRNYLNLEYAPKIPQKEYDPDDEDVPF